ncbi:MAG: hypothetical protein WAV20_03745, partial [Blastocatellia bacterium]
MRRADPQARAAGDSLVPYVVWKLLAALEVSVARYAGLYSYRYVPRARGLALGYMPSPRCAGLYSYRYVPRARRLALGYMPSPAARACVVEHPLSQGSRTRPGLHAVARCAGLWRRASAFPGLADSPWA